MSSPARAVLAADDHIYVSGTFWLTIALVVLTLALIWLAWRTLRVDAARRRLSWRQVVVPMVREDHRNLAGGLSVSWQGQRLDSPTLATVRLANVGGLDIGTSTFDGGRPIIIDFRANVAALLEPEAQEKDDLLPLRLVGNIVEVGPGLLAAGSGLTIVALTNRTVAAHVQFPLVDVQVTETQESLGLERIDIGVKLGPLTVSTTTSARLTVVVSVVTAATAVMTALIAAAQSH